MDDEGYERGGFWKWCRNGGIIALLARNNVATPILASIVGVAVPSDGMQDAIGINEVGKRQGGVGGKTHGQQAKKLVTRWRCENTLPRGIAGVKILLAAPGIGGKAGSEFQRANAIGISVGPGNLAGRTKSSDLEIGVRSEGNQRTKGQSPKEHSHSGLRLK